MKRRGRWFGILWIVVSVFWIDVAVAKVQELQVAGHAVNALRYANVAFWIFMLIYWARFTWSNWGSNKAGKDSI